MYNKQLDIVCDIQLKYNNISLYRSIFVITKIIACRGISQRQIESFWLTDHSFRKHSFGTEQKQG